MTTILGFKKGRGLKPLGTQPVSDNPDVDLDLATRKSEASDGAKFVCTVCGKKFKKLVPMAQNHFNAKHEELNTSKTAYKEFVKPIDEV